MRTARVPAEEQYRLIMECRRSGLSDQQWCVNHDIKPGTFYNWVKRLRQKGCQDLSVATRRGTLQSPPPEVVKIEVDKTAVMQPAEFTITKPALSAMEVSFGSIRLSVPNGTDPVLLAQTIKVLSEFTC